MKSQVSRFFAILLASVCIVIAILAQSFMLDYFYDGNYLDSFILGCFIITLSFVVLSIVLGIVVDFITFNNDKTSLTIKNHEGSIMKQFSSDREIYRAILKHVEDTIETNQNSVKILTKYLAEEHSFKEVVKNNVTYLSEIMKHVYDTREEDKLHKEDDVITDTHKPTKEEGISTDKPLV